ncbi:MAG TPA: DUF885 domain-containing protein, partial [Segetibacter sp.]
MKYLLLILVISFVACKLSNTNPTKEKNTELAALFDNYYEERLKLFPLEATGIGDVRYNNLLPIEFTDSYRDTIKTFYSKYLQYVTKYDRENLDDDDKISYDIFKREMSLNIEGLKYHDNYIPFQQFWGLPLTMGQLGSGEGNQPFKTIKDHEDWLARAERFSAWADSAIIYFRKGIATGFVLPRSLVVKMIPQMESMQATDSTNIFFGPIKKFPSDINDADKQRLTGNYNKLITEKLVPSYKRLADFLKNEYLPKSRATSGIGDLPEGKNFYTYLVKVSTTTNKTPEEIYQTGLSEVARIKRIMDSVKNAVGFKGDIPAFFEHMKTGKEFMPYKTPEEVIGAFKNIHSTMEPNVKKMFNNTPKTPFEIRQTEAFRAASASAEYNQGSPDGSRPGIFYVPILDAAQFNTTSGMESLFLHEAIPGHHYQISLQQEDTMLPKFRRFGGNNAYVEGWALYCESLGKELGLYTDPYQYMGALGDEMHRAIRLVVDVAIHTKGMTHEEAIKYMMENEAISEQGATAEIERYMAIPSQALGYKIGAMKIQELRNKYQQELGSNFKLASFHDNILNEGAMPLEVLETKMIEWAKRV